ncbi:hypothetical protein QFZ62_000285 [Clavibacter sp. B3I6]|uniref:DUF2510 domain-containing protein n=1 Tax=Clavibacter sp. B3I6 TaxID=3042268 RepID=UPI0027870747|nr:DUF2510 domain-containing protein [Clavibacter sp. B3I6]MDQ0742977.1 hypothetical protein [Clavibacter sp. B3I6]
MEDNGERPVPAGWYQAPDGTVKYWDGQQWLAPAAPPVEPAAAEAAPAVAPTSRRPASNRTRWIAGSVAGVLLVGGIGAGVSVKLGQDAQRDREVAAQQAADAAEKVRSDAAAASEKAEKEADDRERATRALSVDGIQESIKKMAEGHAADGLIDGPILDASCSPVGGGSTDDLTETTTVFECFVSSEDNGDGTMSGYNYHATMNWTSGSYTYGLGKD